MLDITLGSCILVDYTYILLIGSEAEACPGYRNRSGMIA